MWNWLGKLGFFFNNDFIVGRYLYQDVPILFIFISPLLTLELCQFEESVVQLLAFLSERLQVV